MVTGGPFEMWEKEKEYFHRLPENRFEACKLVSCQVNKMSLVTIETNKYSVLCKYVGQAVWTKVFVGRVIVVDQYQVIAEHDRSYDRNQIITILDHYLEALLKSHVPFEMRMPFNHLTFQMCSDVFIVR